MARLSVMPQGLAWHLAPGTAARSRCNAVCPVLARQPPTTGLSLTSRGCFALIPEHNA